MSTFHLAAVAALFSLFAVSQLTVADSQIEFAPSVDYFLQGAPWKMAEADFDGVNGTDLVASDDDTPTIVFLLNNGDGTFTRGERITLQSQESDLHAVDLDGVNGPDVATSDLAGTVSVLLNNGDGSFAGAVTYPLDFPPLSGPACITGANLDGVNGVDLAVVIGSFSVLEGNLLAVLMNNGDGTFTAPVYYPLGSLGPHCLATADLDGVNGPDVAVSNRDDFSVSVFRNNGDGTFLPPDRWGAPGAPDRVLTADLDGINGPDLATGNSFDSVGVLLNNGDGTFAPAITYDVAHNAIGLDAADFDGDSDLDIVAAHSTRATDLAREISILPNHGDGTFALFEQLPVGGRTEDVVVADLDGVNGPDIAVTNNTLDSISVLLNATPLVGTTTLVSVASDGTQAQIGAIMGGSLSADGRYVPFYSFSPNLVSNDTNSRADVFVHDRLTGQTSRVSVASDGTQGNGFSDLGFVSDDGRYVAFASIASNLVPNDTNGTWDTFVRNRLTSETSRVSVASDGSEGNDQSGWRSTLPLSADGRYVAFWSLASNLVPNDTNETFDVFVHDRLTGQTSRVNVASDGSQGNGQSGVTDISPDGRYVAFDSFSDNLVPNDTNESLDAFVHDRLTGETSRVSVAYDGTQGNGRSHSGFLSADGRFVAFGSFASNLVPDDSNGSRDVFVRDRFGALPVVGGSVTGMIPRKIKCENKETGQHVTVPLPDDGVWNCEEAGLVFDPGDRIRQRVRGTADGTASVGGAATGISGTKARCDNKSTGKRVVINLNGDNTWDCEEAGLRVRTGDSIVQSVLGTAEQIGPPPDVQTVAIDIKPGDDRNRIRLKPDARVSVAILTDSSFDALQVERASVRFGPGEATVLNHRSEDSDGDGDIDLRLRFDVNDAGIACGDTEATVTGTTFDGQPITGTDSITVVCN